ncbi:LuxR C-terminal-related transcriptional regulator [Streptomyces sp. BA2]|uniref:LuxR C-terminal-related transcriptional regulator n=1 Tax=Streptomyces sp. BA2 TaxID=436595 RepID=UPI00132189AD|nr:LuxR family transcriptional regulator [Streptomyces sp. BA2]MWA08877.1 AAA family ATPase [Streptomyces sp. BA2]
MAFVSRERELGILKEALSNCGHGPSRTIVVTGGAGAGKSALLHAFTEHAITADVTVLSVQGRAVTADPPLSLFHQLVAQSSASLPESQPAPASPAVQFATALPRVADGGLAVICVDDVQEIPWSQLDFLIQTITWHRDRRILLVVTDLPHLPHREAPTKTEFLRRPYTEHIRLGPLDERGVREMTAAEIDRPHDRWVRLLHHLSGGSPLLLSALLEDFKGRDMTLPLTEMEQSTELAMYGQAVMSVLRRSGCAAVKIGCLLSVLGDSASPELLSRMSGISSSLIDAQIAALRDSGVIDGMSFRHRTAQRTVLADVDPSVRTRLHIKVAAAQYSAGAPATEVARHLLAARHTEEPWQRTVLRNAAETAMGEEDTQLGVRCLELALEGCPEGPDRVEIHMRLALIALRMNPTTVEARHLPELMEAFQSGTMPGTACDGLADLLFGCGRLEEAFTVLQKQGAKTSAGDVRAGDHPNIAWLWAWSSFLTPVHSDERPAAFLRQTAHESATALFRTAEGSFLIGDSDDWATAAENLLEVSVLSDATVWSLSSAVKALIIADRLESAWRWCERLVKESAAREAPGWQTVFALLQALVALRQGKLTAGLDCVRLVQLVITERSSAMVCAAESTLAALYIEMGRYDEAARVFAKPVPPAWEKSVYWLSYLRARGCLLIATNRPHAGLSDYLRIGKLAEQFHVDHPTLVPWRLFAAEAWLRLGHPKQAAYMMAEHTARGPRTSGRNQAMALRLQAALAEPHARPRLLLKAANEFHASGDRPELARTLIDLGEALWVLGHDKWAVLARRTAILIAHNCLKGTTPVPREEEPKPPPAAPQRLTRAEHRVAELVAKGLTNRQVARRLHITASTVEQHLTRIYQKLGITHRKEIGIHLGTRTA